MQSPSEISTSLHSPSLSTYSHSPSTAPTSTSTSASPPPRPYADPFAADSDAESVPPSPLRPSQSEVDQEHSDLPLLRRTHLTTGYRAGLSEGKDDPETAQRGFDTGYGIGATLGARVGWVLGILGSLKTLAVRAGEQEKVASLVERMKDVERECSIEKLAEVVEGVHGMKDGEMEGERTTRRASMGMVEAEMIVTRWVTLVEELCSEVGVDMKFPGMVGEKPGLRV